MRVFDDLVHVEIEIRKHVDLVDHQHVRHFEHQRVLQRLVVAFRHGQDDRILHRTGIEFRRADQVAHVLQDREIQVFRAQFAHALAGHVGVEMAHAAGMQLNGAHAGLEDRRGVHVGIDVRFHDADAHLVLQTAEHLLQQRGLAGSGRRHQVEQERLLRLHLRAQFFRVRVVVRENAFFYFDDLDGVHVTSPFPLP